MAETDRSNEAMYHKIYEELRQTGKVKTAILLNGPYAGSKCLVKNGHCVGCATKNDHFDSFDGINRNITEEHLSGNFSVPTVNSSPQLDWSIYEDAILSCEDTGVLHVNNPGIVDTEIIHAEDAEIIRTGAENTGAESKEETQPENTDIFVEIYVRNPRLIILGGGHVSVFVAKIGKILGFHITVMDDREEFVTKERFPDADERIIGSFNELDEKIPPYENAYYVVVTRGHLGDTECARRILRRPYQYFGMIGSKNKVRITRENLLKEGFTENQINTIHAPIGLPLGGQLPEEIAVSILAEIIQVKNERSVTYADENVEAAVMENKKGTMLTIIRQHGSSPRGTGSKMFVDTENRIYGSIGGGNVEYQALKHAREVTHPKTKYYRLTNEGSANLGMICGGEVEVLFELVK